MRHWQLHESHERCQYGCFDESQPTRTLSADRRMLTQARAEMELIIPRW